MMMTDIFSSFDLVLLIPFILNLGLWISPTRMFWLSHSPWIWFFFNSLAPLEFT